MAWLGYATAKKKTAKQIVSNNYFIALPPRSGPNKEYFHRLILSPASMADYGCGMKLAVFFPWLV
jgi:hypothetical protein